MGVYVGNVCYCVSVFVNGCCVICMRVLWFVFGFDYCRCMLVGLFVCMYLMWIGMFCFCDRWMWFFVVVSFGCFLLIILWLLIYMCVMLLFVMLNV